MYLDKVLPNAYHFLCFLCFIILELVLQIWSNVIKKFIKEKKKGFSFYPFVGTQNQPNLRNCFRFYSFGGFIGPSKLSSQ